MYGISSRLPFMGRWSPSRWIRVPLNKIQAQITVELHGHHSWEKGTVTVYGKSVPMAGPGEVYGFDRLENHLG